MKMALSFEFFLLFVVGLPLAYCWTVPWFCHEHECPVYTVVQSSEKFEQRVYEPSQWITTDISSTKEADVRKGFWKLYSFIQGAQVEMTRPVLLSVNEAKGQPSISCFIAPGSNLPDPEDETIKKKDMPSFTVYVRVFGGIASEYDGYHNVELLKKDLQEAEKAFDGSRFEAAGYDSPFNLINRHNEVWVYAA